MKDEFKNTNGKAPLAIVEDVSSKVNIQDLSDGIKSVREELATEALDCTHRELGMAYGDVVKNLSTTEAALGLMLDVLADIENKAKKGKV